MTRFLIGGDCVQVDVEATRAYQDAHGQIAGGCLCADCRNFAAAVGGAPREVGEALARMGVDVAKPTELVERWPDEKGQCLYTALYLLAGTMEEQGDATWEPAPGITGGFGSGLEGLIPEDFPEPNLQLFLELHLPWVLDEPPEQ